MKKEKNFFEREFDQDYFDKHCVYGGYTWNNQKTLREIEIEREKK